MAETDGMISVGDSLGTRWGFIAADFAGDSYLWKLDNVILVSLIASKRTGAFGELVRAIQKDGLQVDVPTPFAKMQRILERWGATERWEQTPDGDTVELWRVPRLPERERRCDNTPVMSGQKG